MKALGVIAAAVAVVALVLVFVETLRLPSLILAIAGALLGMLALGKKEDSKVIEVTAVILSLVAILIYIGFIAFV